jgi:hypothetical protein
MESWWSDTNPAAVAAKDSQQATFALVAEIRGLAPEDRELAEEVIGEWVLSADESKRFDALAVVDELAIRSAIPRLRELESRLAKMSGPGAPFEAKKVQRILAGLGQTSS